MDYTVKMTKEEFKKNGFVTGRDMEIDGKIFRIDRTGTRYFNAFIGGKQITRATKYTIIREIEAELRK